MIIALLIMASGTAGTGIINLAQDEGPGPLAAVVAKVERPPRVPGQRRAPPVIKQVHETLANITLALIILPVLWRCGGELCTPGELGRNHDHWSEENPDAAVPQISSPAYSLACGFWVTFGQSLAR